MSNTTIKEIRYVDGFGWIVRLEAHYSIFSLDEESLKLHIQNLAKYNIDASCERVALVEIRRRTNEQERLDTA